jgi:hypothetical protein
VGECVCVGGGGVGGDVGVCLGVYEYVCVGTNTMSANAVRGVTQPWLRLNICV